ncbi:MAG: hypothetical protein SGI90_12885 [Candidatus Eisenbacteria bacterium]|nr:hypothetical protein [Candidatus Eisenbacteria bacterium]
MSAFRLALALIILSVSPCLAQPGPQPQLVPYYLSLISRTWVEHPTGAIMGALGFQWPEGCTWPVARVCQPPNVNAYLLTWGCRPGTELPPIGARACLLNPDGTIRWNRPVSLDEDAKISDDLVSCFMEYRHSDSLNAYGRPVSNGRIHVTWVDSLGSVIGSWELDAQDAFGPNTYARFSYATFLPKTHRMLFLQEKTFGWERSKSTADDSQVLVCVSLEGGEMWRTRVESRYEGVGTSVSGNLIVLWGRESLPERDDGESQYRWIMTLVSPAGDVLGTVTDEGIMSNSIILIDPRGDRLYYRMFSEVRSIDVIAGRTRVEPDSLRLGDLCSYPDSAVARAARDMLWSLQSQ